MKRRNFIALLGGAAVGPLAAHAQQAGKVHRIGFLGSATAAGSAKAVEALRTGLREFGYVEGTNIGIEFRWAEGIYDRLPRLVAELIATNVDVDCQKRHRNEILGFDEQQEADLREIVADLHRARFERTLEIVLR